jgi:hypothetical protein
MVVYLYPFFPKFGYQRGESKLVSMWAPYFPEIFWSTTVPNNIALINVQAGYLSQLDMKMNTMVYHSFPCETIISGYIPCTDTPRLDLVRYISYDISIQPHLIP